MNKRGFSKRNNKSWITALTGLILILALSLVPVVGARADGGLLTPPESENTYDSWIRHDGDEVETMSELGGAGSDVTAADVENTEPDATEKRVGKLFIGIGDAVNHMFKGSGIDASVTGIIAGRLVNGINYFVFDLTDQNVYGIIGAVIYQTLRSMALSILFIMILIQIIRSLFTGDVRGLTEFKKTIYSAVLAVVLMFIMPQIIDWLCEVRDVMMKGLFTAVCSFTGAGSSDLVDTLSLESAYRTTWESHPTFVNAFIYLLVCCLPFTYLIGYVKIALEQIISFGVFPIFACLSMSDKNALKEWSSVSVINLFVPTLDLTLLMVPTILVQYLAGISSSDTGFLYIRAVIVTTALYAVIPLRNNILRLLGNNIGVLPGEMMGGGLGLGAKAAVAGAGLLAAGLERSGGLFNSVSHDEASQQQKEAQKDIENIEKQQDSIDKGKDPKAELEPVPDAEDRKDTAENTSDESPVHEEVGDAPDTDPALLDAESEEAETGEEGETLLGGEATTDIDPEDISLGEDTDTLADGGYDFNDDYEPANIDGVSPETEETAKDILDSLEKGEPYVGPAEKDEVAPDAGEVLNAQPEAAVPQFEQSSEKEEARDGVLPGVITKADLENAAMSGSDSKFAELARDIEEHTGGVAKNGDRESELSNNFARAANLQTMDNLRQQQTDIVNSNASQQQVIEASQAVISKAQEGVASQEAQLAVSRAELETLQQQKVSSGDSIAYASDQVLSRAREDMSNAMTQLNQKVQDKESQLDLASQRVASAKNALESAPKEEKEERRNALREEEGRRAEAQTELLNAKHERDSAEASWKREIEKISEDKALKSGMSKEELNRAIEDKRREVQGLQRSVDSSRRTIAQEQSKMAEARSVIQNNGAREKQIQTQISQRQEIERQYADAQAARSESMPRVCRSVEEFRLQLHHDAKIRSHANYKNFNTKDYSGVLSVGERQAFERKKALRTLGGGVAVAATGTVLAAAAGGIVTSVAKTGGDTQGARRLGSEAQDTVIEPFVVGSRIAYYSPTLGKAKGRTAKPSAGNGEASKPKENIPIGHNEF